MTINKIYKKILKAYKNQDISLLKNVTQRIYQYGDTQWFYLQTGFSECTEGIYKYRITVKNGLTSSKAKIKRPISQSIFDWLSSSKLSYHSA